MALGSLLVIDHGCKKIFLGLGGSATNDGGCGCAAALGTVFTNKCGESFVPVGGNLAEINAIDNSKTKKRLRGINITIMSDAENPLYGKTGTAYTFVQQKVQMRL